MEQNQSQDKNAMELQLVNAINDSLRHHLASNASFLGERLLAEHDSEDTRHLLAECYVQENKTYKAQHILRNCSSERNKYLLAVCYVKMNNFKDAEMVLKSKANNLNSNLNNNNNIYANTSTTNMSTNSTSCIIEGSYGHFLLAHIYEKQQRFNDAKEQYMKALELNPTLWTGYEALCKMGEQVQPNVFSDSSQLQYEASLQAQSLSRTSDGTLLFNQPFFMTHTNTNTIIINNANIKQSKKANDQPNATTPQFDTAQSQQLHFPKYMNLMQQQQQNISNISMQAQQQPQRSSLDHYQQIMQQTLRSNQPPPFPHPIQMPMNVNLNVNVNAEQQLQLQQKQQSVSSSAQLSTAPSLMQLLRKMAKPFLQMNLYQCKEAVEEFKLLPSNHFNTGWVLTQLGRCMMEQTKYQEAEKYFQEARRVDPCRLDGMEFYSSCLWHLKKQVDLCYLANKALEISVFAPETWIIVGNSCSIIKEHENALKFFNRAIQISPNNAYAHSLCGLEFTYNEDFQKAQKYFETALGLDMRLYNAWWGLGNVHFKQEKYDKAKTEFERAIQINTRCPVLYTYLGMTLSSKGDYVGALKEFDNSEYLEPKNALNKYQKANALVKLEQYKEALTELEQLKMMMPRESPIPLLMGNIYKKLGDVNKAHHYYTQALDLEPKDAQRIKGFIESLHHENDFSEEMEYQY